MQFKKIDHPQISGQVEENFIGNNFEKKNQWLFIIEVFMECLRHPFLHEIFELLSFDHFCKYLSDIFLQA